MKTLVVFLALWSTCFSKPSTLEEQSLPIEATEAHGEFIGRAHLQNQDTDVFDTTHREHPGNPQLIQHSGSSLQGRSMIASQKPSLIKKGYQIYRTGDEGETLIDSKQKCNKQVKVNICEEETEKNSDQIRFDSKFLRTRENMTRDEIKKTIKMVKEVVEHMQKDLQTMVETSTDLLTEEQLQNGQTKTKLQDDFVTLHTVLDDLSKHIEDSSPSSNTDLDKKDDKKSNENTEESRMNQWKNTIKRIQEDSEINIEDRFAKDNEATEREHLQNNSHGTITDNEDKISPQVRHMSSNVEDAEMSIAQDINKKEMLQSDSLRFEEAPLPKEGEENISSKSTDTDHHTLQNGAIKSSQEMTKATEQEDNMMLGVNIMATSQGHTHEKRTASHMLNRKSDEMEQNFNSDKVDEHLSNSNQMDHKNELEFKSQDEHQASESSMKVDHINGQTHRTDLAKQSSNEMDTDTLQQAKTSSKSDTSLESHSSMGMPSRDAPHEVQSEPNNKFHSTINSGTTGVSHQLSESLNTRLAMEQSNQGLRTMSSNEVQTQHDPSQSLFNDNFHGTSSGKANNHADKIDESLQHQLNGQENTRWAQVRGMDTSMSDTHKMNNKIQEGKSGINTQDSMTKSEHATMHHNHMTHQGDHMHRVHESSQHQHSGRVPSDDHFSPSMATSHPNSHSKNHEIHSIHNHNSQLSNGRFAQDHYMMPAMRANMGFEDSSSMSMQSHHSLNNPHGHHFSQGSQSQAMFHNEQISETDSMVQASNHIGMREAMLRSAAEYPQYYNSQGNKGSGYPELPSIQSATGSASGAVGLFPNANLGGCGIPLLVSCSPNVVSGTLAKGQPTYTAPSYRSMDAYRYHKKRDTKNSDSKLDVKTIPKITYKSKVNVMN